jgi:hypothetical protein
MTTDARMGEGGRLTSEVGHPPGAIGIILGVFCRGEVLLSGGGTPINIEREAAQCLLREGAQLVEVLPAKEYEAEHLPGAVSIPLSTLGRHTAARLRQDRPVIVYCYDYQ